MKIEKQEWSKDRIQVEMKELENAAAIRFYFGLPMIFSAAMAIFFGVTIGGFGYFFVIGGLVGIGGILLVKSALAKRRKYNALKTKL